MKDYCNFLKHNADARRAQHGGKGVAARRRTNGVISYEARISKHNVGVRYPHVLRRYSANKAAAVPRYKVVPYTCAKCSVYAWPSLECSSSCSLCPRRFGQAMQLSYSTLHQPIHGKLCFVA